MSQYVHSEALVSTEWLAKNLETPNIRIIESNEDPLLYSAGHVPGAVHIDWVTDLNDQVRRDYLDKDAFEQLMSKHGITNETLVVFYGDKGNWWACYAFWVFQLFGHPHAAIVDGGRKKWEAEKRPLTREVPSYSPTTYKAKERMDYRIRAFRDQVMQHVELQGRLIDVRSVGEYKGELLHMPDYPQEGSLRGGHIPGANNIPWSKATNEDGTFKSIDELRHLYETENGFNPNQNIITYCRIGERSSHTWFVLSYLLGYDNVRNYDGSWTEWGNLVRVPIEK